MIGSKVVINTLSVGAKVIILDIKKKQIQTIKFTAQSTKKSQPDEEIVSEDKVEPEKVLYHRQGVKDPIMVSPGGES